MITLPYKKFVKYCITQGRSLNEIKKIFADRPPFIKPESQELKQIYYEVLQEADSLSSENCTINSKPIEKIETDILPEDNCPVILPEDPTKKELAKELDLYEMWGAMINNEVITKMDGKYVDKVKKAYRIFEEMATPKLHICILRLAGYESDRITELINKRFDLDLTKKSIDIFFDYFWPVDDIAWYKMEEYIEEFVARNNIGQSLRRLFHWALDGELVQLTYKLGYELKTMDEVEMMQDIVMGEYIEMVEHYKGREDINAYERNKIASTMRQAYLFAKGYRELTGKQSPEDIESELVNPEKAALDNYEDEDDFKNKNVISPDMDDIEETEEEGGSDDEQE